MAKKAKTVSWRTLTRQADKERSPRKASALRKLAWAARRADRAAKRKKVKVVPAARRNIVGATRAAKGWATRRRTIKSLARETHKAGLALQIIRAAPMGNKAQCIARDMAADKEARGAPGHGEVVGGVYAEIAERIAKLARKKGGMNGVYNELATLAASSKYQGASEMDKVATKHLIEVQERMAERVVCGFIAEVNQAEAEHRGLPQAMVWTLNSFLITKIVDALNKAGYSASGMQHTARDESDRALVK